MNQTEVFRRRLLVLQTEDELIQRVKKCLRDLRYLSEVPAQRLDPDPVSSSHSESGAPRKSGSSYTTAVRSLEGWCDLQETAHKAVVKGPNRRPETKEEFRARIIAQYDGLSNAEVARRERLSPEYIRQIRAEAKEAA